MLGLVEGDAVGLRDGLRDGEVDALYSAEEDATESPLQRFENDA